MMRPAFFLSAALLAGLAAQALAQEAPDGDPPPLPAYEDGEWEEEWVGEPEAGYTWEAEPGPYDERAERWREHDGPPLAAGRHLGYPPEQRAAWLEECRRARWEGPDRCEEYLLRYERGYAGAPAHRHPSPGYGYYGYPPVVWIKVPIHTVRRNSADCGCEQVVEEWVEEEVVTPPPRVEKRVKIERVAPAPSKTVKIQRTAPPPSKTAKSSK